MYPVAIKYILAPLT